MDRREWQARTGKVWIAMARIAVAGQARIGQEWRGRDSEGLERDGRAWLEMAGEVGSEKAFTGVDAWAGSGRRGEASKGGNRYGFTGRDRQVRLGGDWPDGPECFLAERPGLAGTVRNGGKGTDGSVW